MEENRRQLCMGHQERKKKLKKNSLLITIRTLAIRLIILALTLKSAPWPKPPSTPAVKPTVQLSVSLPLEKCVWMLLSCIHRPLRYVVLCCPVPCWSCRSDPIQLPREQGQGGTGQEGGRRSKTYDERENGLPKEWQPR